MKVYSRIGAMTLVIVTAIFAGPISAIFAGSAQAQLLGGVLGGSDSTVTVPGVGDVTVPGGSGSTVGTNSAGVPDVAMVTTSPNGNGGSNVGINLLGGGNNGVNLPVGNNNAGVGLPGVGGLGGLGGTNGTNGTNGNNGAPGTGGPNFVLYGSANPPGAIGPNGATITGGSSKLRMLLNVMQNRGWLRFVAGNAICLPGYGVANIQGWLPQKDWAQLQQVVATYAQDIYTLRTMLSKCRSGGAKLNQADLNRVIGVDIGASGQPVLFML